MLQVSHIPFGLDIFLTCLSDFLRDELSAPVSISVRDLTTLASNTRTGCKAELWFVVKSMFVFQIKRCRFFSWQHWQVLVFLHSEVLCFDPVQMQQSFFARYFNLWSATLLTALQLLELCPPAHARHKPEFCNALYFHMNDLNYLVVGFYLD